MKKRGIVLFVMGGFSGGMFAGEDAAFDFTNDALNRLDDTTYERRDDEKRLLRELPLDERNRFVTRSSSVTPGERIISSPLVVPNDNMIIDPLYFEQDVSPRDNAALKALNDDHVFFDDLDDEKKKNTTFRELCRTQLRDCLELITRSAVGVREADPVLYELLRLKFSLAEKEVTRLMVHADTLQVSAVSVLENSVQGLKASVVEKVVGGLFKVLIIDALELAVHKLSHLRVTLGRMQLKHRKKEHFFRKKDTRRQIEEASYADY
jgi:hypothetical protein